jgi:hypothetical protein
VIERLLIAAAIVVVVTGVARLIRRSSDAPTQPTGRLPAQLNRYDFISPESPWLVVIFTSATCHVCESVVAKAAVLGSDSVAVQHVAFQEDRDLHERYLIDSVPALLIADVEGVVRYARLGPVTATDLWAAMAEVREPGSVAFDDNCSDG